MSKIRNFINKTSERAMGHIGLFLIVVISFACEHSVLPRQRAVREA